jgi:hypothetical protein
MIYPNSKVTFEDLFYLSFRYWWRGFKQIYPIIVLLVVLKAFYTYLSGLPILVAAMVLLVEIAVIIVIFTLAMYRIHAMLQAEMLSWADAWRLTMLHIRRVLIASGIILAGMAAIFFLGRWLVFVFLGLQGAQAAVGAMILMGMPLILIIMYSYLTLPMLALTERSIGKAFRDSLYYTKDNFLAVLLIYFEAIVIFVASATYTRHSQWLLSHHLMEIGDLLVFSIMLPLILSQTLLLLHNRDKFKI